jgi:hypothetical protein
VAEFPTTMTVQVVEESTPIVASEHVTVVVVVAKCARTVRS